jgi:hypothetical protein
MRPASRREAKSATGVSWVDPNKNKHDNVIIERRLLQITISWELNRFPQEKPERSVSATGHRDE